MAGKKTVKVEKKVIKKEAQDQSESVSEVPKSSKISEFFMHLMAYGGINYQNGILYVWGDPTIFFPLKSFIFFQHEIIKELGKEGEEMFYWLGKLNGNNATKMLKKRYGIKIEDIDKFILGASQDGFGYTTLTSLKPDKINPKEALIESTNSSLAIAYKKIYGQSKGPVDFYLLGVLVGGSEALFDTSTIGEEQECMAQGNTICKYYLRSVDEPEKFRFFKDKIIDEKKILKRAEFLYLNRKSNFNLLTKKNIKFGDGTFFSNNIQGCIIASLGWMVFNYILLKKMGKKYLSILEQTAQESIEALSININSLSSKNSKIQLLLKELEIFGFGESQIILVSDNKCVFQNRNSNYPIDYKYVFGKSSECIDYYYSFLLKSIINKYFSINADIVEKSCIAQGKDRCIYEIYFKTK